MPSHPSILSVIQPCQVPPEAVRRMELELRKTVAEIADVKKVVSKSSRKVDSLEKEVRQMKALVEDISSEQTLSGSRLVGDSGEELLTGTAAKPLASGDVQLRPQV